ncbi:MAG: hypothetical protein GX935_05665 [Erysipelotrichia bacterium]|nr:hypothetical protein [Erysipelotrichia bacterium]
MKMKKNKAKVIKTKPEFLWDLNEYGIEDSKVRIYTRRQWINSTKTEYGYGYLGFGICGSVCTAICLSYLNNNIDNQIIVNEPYSFIDGNFAKWLIHLLKPHIEPPLPGAFGKDIIRGIKWFYNSKYSNIDKGKLLPYKVKNINQYKKSIKAGYPVMLYLNKVDKTISPYGLHWVVGYKYIEYQDKTFFQVIDTWGYLAYIDEKLIKYGVCFKY